MSSESSNGSNGNSLSPSPKVNEIVSKPQPASTETPIITPEEPKTVSEENTQPPSNSSPTASDDTAARKRKRLSEPDPSSESSNQGENVEGKTVSATPSTIRSKRNKTKVQLFLVFNFHTLLDQFLISSLYSNWFSGCH